MKKQAQVPTVKNSYNSTELTALLKLIAVKQDKKGFAELFQYFAPRVKSYALRLGCSEIMAEDVAQQTMVKVWQKSNLFDETKASASTWIFRIARNLRIDMLRKETYFHFEDFDFTTVEDESDTAETTMTRSQSGEAMRVALKHLPENQANVIRLSFYDGLSHIDIARKLRLPLGTVKSRLRLALSKLRQEINHDGELRT